MKIQYNYKNRMLSTKEAAEATGLSVYELQMGAKSGKYPCLIIGRNGKGQGGKMKWNLRMLQEAIERHMTERMTDMEVGA